MSFLAPLYLLAGLAITLPIVFHMIRRTPQGRQIFSSVMFLSPSPPRMTKRSRIEDWLLLFLRALAFCLLAFAFARPFLREQALGDSATQGIRQRMVILVDRSASMQRPGYWNRALDEVEKTLQLVKSGSQCCVKTFDHAQQMVISFEEWDATPQDARVSIAMERIQAVKPGWGGTSAGQAMLDGMELLQSDQEQTQVQKRLIVVSDFQTGGHWDVLQGSSWPDDIVVQVRDVSIPDSSNASMQIVRNQQSSDGAVRVRVSNSPSSMLETFHLRWKSAGSKETSQAVQSSSAAASKNLTYVAAGQSRIIQAPEVPEGVTATALELTGDDVEFDNIRYLVPTQMRDIHILYLGDKDEPDSPEGLRFFLKPLFPDHGTRKVTIRDWSERPVEASLDAEQIDLFVVGGTPDQQQLTQLSEWVHQGGQLLFVARAPDQGRRLYSLLRLPESPLNEVKVSNYAMLGKIQFEHPVMKPFSDPRFSDFTKLRYWHYREYDLAELDGVDILAEYDDGSPALAEIAAGQGRIFLFTSGWNRSDSELAVWSKFVPLMNGLLEYASPGRGPDRQLLVGERLPLAELGINSDEVHVRFEDQYSISSRDDSLELEVPGLYRFADSKSGLDAGNPLTIAVNIAPDESRTEPYSLELLSTMGVPVDLQGDQEMQSPLKAERERQLMNRELESRQQWWRWLIAAGLGVLLLETTLATRRTARIGSPGV